MSTVYYRGPDVVITDEVFVVWTPARLAFRLDELEAVHVVRQPVHPIRIVLGVISALSLLGTIAVWPFIQSPMAYLWALAAVSLPSLALIASIRFTPRAFELRAVNQGAEVLLFRSTDETTFGQVRRGLLRTFEAKSSVSVSERLANARIGS